MIESKQKCGVGHEGYPWLADERFYEHKAEAWRWMTEEHLSWIVEQRATGKSNRSISSLFEVRFKRVLSPQTIGKIADGGGMPAFKWSGKRICPGCRATVISMPCVYCVAKKRVKAMRGASN